MTRANHLPQARRRPLRRAVSLGLSHVFRVAEALPTGRWMRRNAQRGLEVRELDIVLDRGDPRLDGMRIALLSDLHAGHFLLADDVRRLAQRTMALRPDLVCLGGDLINTRLAELRQCVPLWQELAPPLGTFAVPGNHDCFAQGFAAPWHRTLALHGIPVLTNRGVRVSFRGAPLWLCGVDDLTEGRPDLAAALRGRGEDEPTVLLSHHPDLFAHAAEHGVDLQLSGHTHGGQLVVAGRSPFNHSRHGYLHGHHRRDRAQLYVGRGVGVTVLPLRVGARPELPVLTLRLRG